MMCEVNIILRNFLTPTVREILKFQCDLDVDGVKSFLDVQVPHETVKYHQVLALVVVNTNSRITLYVGLTVWARLGVRP